MIAYADGTEARLGDSVNYDGEPSTVEAILDSSDHCATWGLAERGMMFKNATFGLVFEPVDSSAWERIEFLGRHE
jgi:hypothetical protein